jgi:hypothetical protein
VLLLVTPLDKKLTEASMSITKRKKIHWKLNRILTPLRFRKAFDFSGTALALYLALLNAVKIKIQ